MVCVGRGDWVAWAEADGLCASNRTKRKELISSGAALGRYKIVFSVVVDNDKTIQFFTPVCVVKQWSFATIMKLIKVSIFALASGTPGIYIATYASVQHFVS